MLDQDQNEISALLEDVTKGNLSKRKRNMNADQAMKGFNISDSESDHELRAVSHHRKNRAIVDTEDMTELERLAFNPQTSAFARTFMCDTTTNGFLSSDDDEEERIKRLSRLKRNNRDDNGDDENHHSQSSDDNDDIMFSSRSVKKRSSIGNSNGNGMRKKAKGRMNVDNIYKSRDEIVDQEVEDREDYIKQVYTFFCKKKLNRIINTSNLDCSFYFFFNFFPPFFSFLFEELNT